MHASRFLIWLVIIILILIGGYYLLKEDKTVAPEVPTQDIKDLPLFKDGLSAVGIEVSDLGFSDFSPDGRYFLFNVFKEGRVPANHAYLMNTESREIVLLPGMPERGFDDNRILKLYSPEGTIIYWLDTKEHKTYPLGENVFMTILSPDGKTLVANTVEGLKKVNIDTGDISIISTKQYDGAYAWFSDSTRMLGFQETEEDLFEAGKGRRLGIWNIKDSTFEALPVELEQKSIRYIEWVVPDKIARVNAGWDDGSFDYLIDINTNEVIYIGDTSMSLMGGIISDPSRSLFAVIDNTDNGERPRVFVYKGMNLITENTLEPGYMRDSVEIVDENTLLYIRKSYGGTGVQSQELVRLNINTGIESVIETLPLSYAELSLAPEHKTWVVATGTRFITGTL